MWYKRGDKEAEDRSKKGALVKISKNNNTTTRCASIADVASF
jgi:hypothetical protein